ncbi:MAG: pyridoxamine 5'-phosphate oxidase [Rhodobacteraceae bacterium]|nr:pyridoxamine 5'-phosphate oxidase [Paracoccaceae bacterium]
MSDEVENFKTVNPMDLFKSWLEDAENKELNDPNAIALATVDDTGLPNVRMVLLKEITDQSFIFYTNYKSVKAEEIVSSPKASFLIHWKSIRRQIRVRGFVEKEDGVIADKYFSSRSLDSRIGAWASRQSQEVGSRQELLDSVNKLTVELGSNPSRPPFWGGFRITPIEIEFWSDGDARLHNRFRWSRKDTKSNWKVCRLQP